MHVEVRNACASEEMCACKSKCLAYRNPHLRKRILLIFEGKIQVSVKNMISAVSPSDFDEHLLTLRSTEADLRNDLQDVRTEMRDFLDSWAAEG